MYDKTIYIWYKRLSQLNHIQKGALAFKRLQGIKDILSASIKDSQQMQNQPADTLTEYMNTTKQNPKLTEEHAIQQYMMLIFAGVDKTSNLFGSCCYALAIHFQFQ